METSDAHELLQTIESTSAIVLLLDADGRVTYANASGRAILPENATIESMGRAWEFTPEEQREQHEAYRIARETGVWGGIVVLSVADRPHRVLSVRILARRHSERFLGWVVFARDLESDDDYIQKLRVSDQRWRLLMMSATDGIWENHAATGEAFFSPQAKALLGFSDDEFPNDLAAWRARIHNDDLSTVETLARQVQAGETNHYAIEYRIRARDDTYRRILSRGHATFDADGKHIRSVGFFTDLTAQRRAEDWQRRVTDLVDDVIALHDDNLVLLYANPALTRLTGISLEKAGGVSVYDACHPDDRDAIAAGHALLKRGQEARLEWRIRCHDGRFRWLETRARPLDEDLWRPAHYLCWSRDITERKWTEHTLLHRSRHDALTGLANRAFFLEQLGDSLKQRPPDTRVGVLFIDLDGFKRINDSLGHAVGDALLRAVGKRLTEIIRDGDIVARMGGDEFTVLLSKIMPDESVEQIVDHIRQHLSQPLVANGHTLFLSASVGVTTAPGDGVDAEDLLRRADMAMYRAKARGGGVRFFQPSMAESTRVRLREETALRLALRAELFRLHYQPLVDLKTGAVVGVEALLRGGFPTGEFAPNTPPSIAPARFVALAEETGLIDELTDWTLRQAVADARRWLDRDLARGARPLKVAVNISARQFGRPSFVETVAKILADAGLPPSCLELEITETAVLGNSTSVLQTLQTLRDIGIGLALDDFGTGYASLSYLRRLPVNKVKIDREFLSDVAQSETTRHVVRAMIEMSHALGLEVVAEGVETVEQRDWMRKLACDLAQGWLFGHAVAADRV